MKKYLITSVCLLALAACGGSKKDYTILESSGKERPVWINNPEAGASKKDAEKYRYFTDHSENASQRLCENSAKTRADAKIAAEVSQFITSAYTEALQNDTSTIEDYNEERLAREAQGYIVGSQVASTYWEKRFYQEELGADADKKAFHCYALIRVDKKTLERATNASIDKFVAGMNKQAKQKALDALKKAEDAFINGDVPTAKTED